MVTLRFEIGKQGDLISHLPSGKVVLMERGARLPAGFSRGQDWLCDVRDPPSGKVAFARPIRPAAGEAVHPPATTVVPLPPPEVLPVEEGDARGEEIVRRMVSSVEGCLGHALAFWQGDQGVRRVRCGLPYPLGMEKLNREEASFLASFPLPATPGWGLWTPIITEFRPGVQVPGGWTCPMPTKVQWLRGPTRWAGREWPAGNTEPTWLHTEVCGEHMMVPPTEGELGPDGLYHRTDRAWWASLRPGVAATELWRRGVKDIFEFGTTERRADGWTRFAGIGLVTSREQIAPCGYPAGTRWEWRGEVEVAILPDGREVLGVGHTYASGEWAAPGYFGDYHLGVHDD